MILQPVVRALPAAEGLSGPQRVALQRTGARRALDDCARFCELPPHEWTKDDRGVPQPTAGLYWSVSHKPGWAAAVIANRPVGIDLEQIRPRRNDLSEAVASAEEWARAGGCEGAAFFYVWTAKEAVLKANGVGIGELRACAVQTFDGHSMVLSYRSKPWHVRYLRWQDHLAAVTVDDEPVLWHVCLSR